MTERGIPSGWWRPEGWRPPADGPDEAGYEHPADRDDRLYRVGTELLDGLSQAEALAKLAAEREVIGPCHGPGSDGPRALRLLALFERRVREREPDEAEMPLSAVAQRPGRLLE